ncbi:MAG: hypothetical protein K2N18_06415 [Clostridia bacterium]|nr:hypothetical protein [Clostridia bacterium]
MSVIDINAILRNRIPPYCKTCKHLMTLYYFDGRTLLVPQHECNKKFVFDDDCELWEKNEGLNNRQKESVKNVLCEIRDKLTVIETMLIEEDKFKNAPE